ncbi:hypothetical protein ACVWVZ_000122 [Pseudomonas tolaasii]
MRQMWNVAALQDGGQRDLTELVLDIEAWAGL